MAQRKMSAVITSRRAQIFGKVIFNFFVWISVANIYVSGYNVEINKASFARGDVGSQFGYSVAVVKTPALTDVSEKSFHAKTLLVGAPNKDVVHFETGDLIKGHGEVRQCRIHKRSRQDIMCSHLETRDPNNMCKKLSLNYTKSYCETNMRMGMTLAFNPKYDELNTSSSSSSSSTTPSLITVCAPLWKNTYMEVTTSHQEMYGMCLRMGDDLKVHDCLGNPRNRNKGCWPFWPLAWDYRFDGGKPIFTYAEAGMSVTYAQDGRSDIIGGPGTRAWSGAVAFPALSTFYPEHNHITMSEYKGYAVTSGKYRIFAANLAVGVPNKYSLTGAYFGQVALLRDSSQRFLIEYGQIYECANTSRGLPPFNAEQTGTKFGAALASVDVDGDGWDELFVGAPLYTGENTDEGRVFVYKFTSEDVCGPVGILSGSSRVTSLMDKSYKGRFGTSIASVGDLDKDGYNDVAVGAPYEDDGRGAVYIYRGNPGNDEGCCLMEDKYSQRIVGRDLDPGLRGFGWTIFGDVDVDDNDYPDLAIGAYASDTAVIMRSRPLVEVKVTLRVDPDPIPLSATSLDCSEDGFRICTIVHVTMFFESKDVRKCSVALDLNADTAYQQQTKQSRVYFRESKGAILSENITLHSGELTSRAYILDVELYQGDPTPKDQWTPMRVAGEIHLVESYRHRFAKLDPLLRDTVATSFSYNAFFDKKCERIDLCISDTVVDVQLVFKRRGLSETVNNSTVLFLGNAQELVMTIDITNTKDTSYDLNFTINANVHLKGEVEYIFGGSEDGCEVTGNGTLGTSVYCAGASRLDKKDKLRAVVYLDVSPELLAGPDLISFQNSLNITVNAVQANVDEAPENNEFRIVIPVQLKSDLNIVEDSRTSAQVRLSSNKNSELALPILHRFFITNFGPSYSLNNYMKISVPVSRGSSQIAAVKNISASCQMVDEYMLGYVNEKVAKFLTGNESDGSLESSRSSPSPSADITCDTYRCDVIMCRLRPLAVQEQETVYVEVDVFEKELAALELSRSVLYESSAAVMDPSLLYEDVVAKSERPFPVKKRTTFRVAKETTSQDIPLWILLASGGGAVVFLLLLILILYKCGFFRRRKHDEFLKMREKSLYPHKPRSHEDSQPDMQEVAGHAEQTEDALLRHKSRASMVAS